MAHCPICKRSFKVPEDESPQEYGCPRCGFFTLVEDDDNDEGSDENGS